MKKITSRPMQSKSIVAGISSHFCHFAFIALVFGAEILLPMRTLAQYTLVASDAGGTSSLTGTTNWSPATTIAPTNILATNYTYTVPTGSFTLRSPTGGANYTVYGNIVMTGGSLGMKGYGNYTFENLELNGGGLYNSGTSGPLAGQNNCFVYGCINLAASSQIRNSAAGTTNYVYALITNSPSITPVPTLTFNVGGTIVLAAANTFTGNITVINNTPSPILQLGINNAIPSLANVQLNGSSTSGNTPTVLDLNGFSTTIANLAFTSGSVEVGYVTNSAVGKTSTLTIGFGSPTSYFMNGGTIADNPNTAGTLALTKIGNNTYTLNTTNGYHGSTIISAGTLALGTTGSISNSASINLAAGATFDVSAISSFALSSSTSLSASGTGASPATISGSSTVSLGSQAINLTYVPTTTNGDASDPALVVSQGALSLNNNSFTVNNASGAPLGPGTYELILVASGTITENGSPSYALTVTGNGVAAQTTSAIQVSGGSVNLVVTANANPTPTFSNLTANENVTYGTSRVTLSGKVSATGPIYPANGEPITVSINGNVQATTVNDSTGDFSINYDLSGIPASGTPYTITYSYGGDGSLGAAVNTSKTLTVQSATPAFSGLPASKAVSYGTPTVTLSGKVSAGSVYPASGEAVVVSINGNAQTNTISDSTGDFSLNYNLADIPFNATSYTITYSYAGDGSLNAAVNTSTTLTVQTNTITETLTTADPILYSSLTNASSWTPTTTVFPTSASATNYNFIVGTTLRTPPGASNYIVDVNSMTVNPGGVLTFKGYGTVTVSNLILNGGGIKNASTGGTPDESSIAGYINLAASSSLTPDDLTTSVVNIESLITNAVGIDPAPTLTCSSGGTVILSAQNTFSGNIVVTGGGAASTILQLGTNNALPATAGVTLNGAASFPGILDLNGFSTTISNLAFSSTEAVQAYVMNSASNTSSTLTLGNGNTTETLQFGTIMDNLSSGGTVALAKIGTGNLTLNSAETYSGNTTISGGTLALGPSGSILNSAEIMVVTNAAFDVSQGYFDLGANQILAGSGTVNGSVQADGTISPVGTLTFNNDLTFDGNLTFTVNKSLAHSNDVMVVAGALYNNGTGTLTVTNLGPTLVAGDTFTLFNQPVNNGSSLTIVPPPGVVLSNNLAVNGALTVLSVTPPSQPRIQNVTVSGSNIVLTGTQGTPNATYYVLTSTNAALSPLSLWTRVATNTFGTDGSFTTALPVNPGQPAGFFVVVTPP
jgi:autotransporter-associated beta strand protein